MEASSQGVFGRRRSDRREVTSLGDASEPASPARRARGTRGALERRAYSGLNIDARRGLRARKSEGGEPRNRARTCACLAKLDEQSDKGSGPRAQTSPAPVCRGCPGSASRRLARKHDALRTSRRAVRRFFVVLLPGLLSLLVRLVSGACPLPCRLDSTHTRARPDADLVSFPYQVRAKFEDVGARRVLHQPDGSYLCGGSPAWPSSSCSASPRFSSKITRTCQRRAVEGGPENQHEIAARNCFITAIIYGGFLGLVHVASITKHGDEPCRRAGIGTVSSGVRVRARRALGAQIEQRRREHTSRAGERVRNRG